MGKLGLRVLTCLPSYTSAFKGKQLQDTPGAGLTLIVVRLYLGGNRGHQAPKQETDNLDLDSFVSPHPSAVQPPPPGPQWLYVRDSPGH